MPKYRLPDEPRPGALGRIAVNPAWPMLAIMVAGAWLSWPWFAVNAHAIGSPRRWLMTAIALGGFVVVGGTWAGIIVVAPDDIGPVAAGLAILGLIVLKLAFAYALFAMQLPSFHLHAYYRGVVRNGGLVVLAGWLVARELMPHVPGIVRMVVR